MAQQEPIQLATMKFRVRSSVAMSCGVDHSCGSDLVLLWLWWRPEAVAPIRPLAWEPPCAMGAALKRPKKKGKKKEGGRKKKSADLKSKKKKKKEYMNIHIHSEKISRNIQMK